MKRIRSVLLLSIPLALAACSTSHNPAPIVERPIRVEPKPVVTGPRQMDSHGYYMVRRGDTLKLIAQDFGQSVHDLVVWNSLDNPNDIRVDQMLRVTPPAAGSETHPGPAVAVAPPHVTGPLGEKKPYSDATLAEMQKPEASPSAVTAKPIEKPVEKPVETPSAANPEDAAVSWMWPTAGKVVGGFDDTRKGLDIGGKAGQPVVAAAAGKVMYAGSGIRGYGNLVIIKHTNNLLSAYAHNKTILVKEGQNVAKGEKIAEMGNSDTDAVKLHFEIRQQGKPVDPSKFLPNR
jgi:lipoprotein NlpD